MSKTEVVEAHSKGRLILQKKFREKKRKTKEPLQKKVARVGEKSNLDVHAFIDVEKGAIWLPKKKVWPPGAKIRFKFGESTSQNAFDSFFNSIDFDYFIA